MEGYSGQRRYLARRSGADSLPELRERVVPDHGNARVPPMVRVFSRLAGRLKRLTAWGLRRRAGRLRVAARCCTRRRPTLPDGRRPEPSSGLNPNSRASREQAMTRS